MRGVTFPGNRQAEIREFPDPHAGPGEAVLKVKASGLCGTDLHRYRGSEPTDMITGHEPCGVIEELGPGAPPGIKIGDRVICHHYAGCGVCENCAMGYCGCVGSPRCRQGQHRYDRCEPFTNPTNDEESAMSICPNRRPSGPAQPPGRRLGAGLGLSPSIPARSKRLEPGFPGRGRYTRARQARRWSRPKVKWQMSALMKKNPQ